MKLKDAAKEKRIVAMTLEIVHKKGLSGLKMSDLAKRVKIAPSNLYIYFKNKEDLLRSVFFSIIERMGQLVMQRTDEIVLEKGPFKKKFFDFYCTIIDFKMRNTQEFSFVKQFFQSPFFKEIDLATLDVYTENIFRLIFQGREEMIFKDEIDFILLLATFDGTIDKLIELHHNGKIILDETTIKNSYDLVWDALRQ